MRAEDSQVRLAGKYVVFEFWKSFEQAEVGEPSLLLVPGLTFFREEYSQIGFSAASGFLNLNTLWH